MNEPALKLEPVTEGYRGLNKSTHDHILKLTLTKFYGSLTLKFEDGKVILMQEIKSVKP